MSQSKLNFKPATAHDAHTYTQLIASQLSTALSAAPSPSPLPPRPVGRPKKQREAATALADGAAAEAEAEKNEERESKRRKYTSWFNTEFITDILTAYRKSSFNARRTVSSLRQSDPVRYARLSHSTIMSWFDKNAKGKLLPHFQEQYDNAVAVGRGNGRIPALEREEAGEVEEEIKKQLLLLRGAGTPLNSRVVKWVMMAIIDEKCPEIYNHTKLSQASISRWVRAKLDWRWRCSTTAASKLPLDWEDQGVQMAMRIAANMGKHKVC